MQETDDQPGTPTPARRRLSGGDDGLLNLFAVVFLLLSCVGALCVSVIFLVPGIVPASFRPVAVPELVRLTGPGPITGPTATLAPGVVVFPTLPPEWTATNTPTITPTPLPNTPTPIPSNTPPRLTKTPTLTATSTPTRTPRGPTFTPTRTLSPFNYTLEAGYPKYLRNFLNNPPCNWMGIYGQAKNLKGQPQIGLLVHLEGGGLSLDRLTGDAPQYGQGLGYYEIPLSTTGPVETTNVYRIQLRNASGQPLSDNYVIPTKGNCNQNLIQVNFAQNH